MQVFARDVLPVVGFVLLRGRCRGCAGRIPRRHLFGELAMGAYWAGAAGLFGAGVLLPVVLLAVVLLAPLVAVLLDRRWAAYGAGGGLGAAALLGGVLTARGPRQPEVPLGP